MMGTQTPLVNNLCSGADPCCSTCRGRYARSVSRASPLGAALASGNVELVRQLVRHGADPNVRLNDGSTIVHAASEGGCLPLLEGLLPAYCSTKQQLNSQSINGETPMHVAARVSDRLSSIAWLLHKGASVRRVDRQYDTPLHVASACGNAGAVALLVKHGSNPRSIGQHGRTPLHVAAVKCTEDQFIAVLRCLLGMPAPLMPSGQNGGLDSPQSQTREPQRPNAEAAGSVGSDRLEKPTDGAPEALSAIERPLDPAAALPFLSARDDHGATPLQVALEAKNSAVAGAIIDIGLSVATETSPAMSGSAAGSLHPRAGVMGVLGAIGAAASGPAAIIAAASAAVQTTIKQDFPPAQPGLDTLLHTLSESSASGAITEMVERGANPFTVCDAGLTPLQKAVRGGHGGVVDSLLNAMQGGDTSRQQSLQRHIGTMKQAAGGARELLVVAVMIDSVELVLLLRSQGVGVEPPACKVVKHITAKRAAKQAARGPKKGRRIKRFANRKKMPSSPSEPLQQKAGTAVSSSRLTGLAQVRRAFKTPLAAPATPGDHSEGLAISSDEDDDGSGSTFRSSIGAKRGADGVKGLSLDSAVLSPAPDADDEAWRQSLVVFNISPGPQSTGKFRPTGCEPEHMYSWRDEAPSGAVRSRYVPVEDGWVPRSSSSSGHWGGRGSLHGALVAAIGYSSVRMVAALLKTLPPLSVLDWMQVPVVRPDGAVGMGECHQIFRTTPLDFAVQIGRLQVVNLLLDRLGFPPPDDATQGESKTERASDQVDRTVAAASGAGSDCGSGVELNDGARGRLNWTVWTSLCRPGSEKASLVFLRRGATDILRLRGGKGGEANSLHAATAGKQTEVVKAMIESIGVEKVEALSRCTIGSRNVWQIAAASGAFFIIRLFLDHDWVGEDGAFLYSPGPDSLSWTRFLRSIAEWEPWTPNGTQPSSMVSKRGPIVRRTKGVGRTDPGPGALLPPRSGVASPRLQARIPAKGPGGSTRLHRIQKKDHASQESHLTEVMRGAASVPLCLLLQLRSCGAVSVRLARRMDRVRPHVVACVVGSAARSIAQRTQAPSDPRASRNCAVCLLALVELLRHGVTPVPAYQDSDTLSKGHDRRTARLMEMLWGMNGRGRDCGCYRVLPAGAHVSGPVSEGEEAVGAVGSPAGGGSHAIVRKHSEAAGIPSSGRAEPPADGAAGLGRAGHSTVPQGGGEAIQAAPQALPAAIAERFRSPLPPLWFMSTPSGSDSSGALRYRFGKQIATAAGRALASHRRRAMVRFVRAAQGSSNGE